MGSTDTEQQPELLVDTKVGAAHVVAAQVPVALRPDAPTAFATIVPPNPHTLRDRVGNDLGSLLLILAVVCLVIGAVGIANTMIVAILERTAESGYAELWEPGRGTSLHNSSPSQQSCDSPAA